MFLFCLFIYSYFFLALALTQSNPLLIKLIDTHKNALLWGSTG